MGMQTLSMEGSTCHRLGRRSLPPHYGYVKLHRDGDRGLDRVRTSCGFGRVHARAQLLDQVWGQSAMNTSTGRPRSHGSIRSTASCSRAAAEFERIRRWPCFAMRGPAEERKNVASLVVVPNGGSTRPNLSYILIEALPSRCLMQLPDAGGDGAADFLASWG